MFSFQGYLYLWAYTDTAKDNPPCNTPKKKTIAGWGGKADGGGAVRWVKSDNF